MKCVQSFVRFGFFVYMSQVQDWLQQKQVEAIKNARIPQLTCDHKGPAVPGKQV